MPKKRMDVNWKRELLAKKTLNLLLSVTEGTWRIKG